MTPRTLAALARHRALVTSLLSATSDEVTRIWIRAWADIEADIIRATSSPARSLRLRTARKRAAQRILLAAQYSSVTVTARARVALELAMAEQHELIGSQLRPSAGVTLTRPAGAEVDAMATRTSEQITARHYALAADTAAAMKRELVLGVAAGGNPREVARRIVNRAEGAFHGGLARALVIARTEIIDAHREAAMATQDANSDVLTGWMWWAQLSDRTCPSCLVQHGHVHDLSESGPLDHQQGRCARMPVVDPKHGLPRPKVTTGEQWLRRQPPEVQREILGPRRHDAWKAGHYPPERWSVKRSTDGWRDSYGPGPMAAPSAQPRT